MSKCPQPCDGGIPEPITITIEFSGFDPSAFGSCPEMRSGEMTISGPYSPPCCPVAVPPEQCEATLLDGKPPPCPWWDAEKGGWVTPDGTLIRPEDVLPSALDVGLTDSR